MNRIIYTNFDKVEVSFQGALPASMLDKLSEAKEKAQQENTEQIISIGKINAQVNPNGAKGGYAYSFSTGATGAIVAIKHDTNPQNWNIRISIRSACLATQGLQGALEHIRDICNGLGALGVRRVPESKQEPFDTLVESIARVDYCMDVIANDFVPNPQRAVAHSRAQRKYHIAESEVVERGKAIESVTIGKMPNKQICLYDKTKEIAAKKTAYWYDIWSTVSYTVDAPTVMIDGNDTVWRFEVRVGKDALKDAGITTFQHLQERLGILYARILDQTRLAVDDVQGDNPKRWPTHPLWEQFQHIAGTCFEHEAVVMPATIVTEKLRDERITMMEKSLLGNFISYAALIGKNLDGLDRIMDSIKEVLAPYRDSDPIGIAEKYRHAMERYANL